MKIRESWLKQNCSPPPNCGGSGFTKFFVGPTVRPQSLKTKSLWCFCSIPQKSLLAPFFSRLQPPGILCFKFNICKSLTCNNQYFNQCVSHNIWLVNKPVFDHIVSNYCKLLMGGCTRFDVEPISCNLLGLLIKNIPITLYMLNFKSCAPSL